MDWLGVGGEREEEEEGKRGDGKGGEERRGEERRGRREGMSRDVKDGSGEFWAICWSGQPGLEAQWRPSGRLETREWAGVRQFFLCPQVLRGWQPSPGKSRPLCTLV